MLKQLILVRLKKTYGGIKTTKNLKRFLVLMEVIKMEKLQNQITNILEDSKMTNEQKSIMIISEIKQYIADHDNELFNQIGEVFSSMK